MDNLSNPITWVRYRLNNDISIIRLCSRNVRRLRVDSLR